MMKLIHSFNTRPLTIDLYGSSGMLRAIGSVWYFALSLAYAVRSGAEVELHTDSLGKALLGHLPYKSIYLSLDDMPDALSPRLWASGKICALQAAGCDTVHIDGDVFIKQRSLLDDIETAQWDNVVAGLENLLSNVCYQAELPMLESIRKTCEAVGMDLYLDGVYNAGVLGFRNSELMRIYTTGYLKMAMALSLRCREALEQNTYRTPDLWLEQVYLNKLCRNFSARTYFVVDPYTAEKATSIGFQHVMTNNKWRDLPRVKTILEKISPDIFNKTKRLCHI